MIKKSRNLIITSTEKVLNIIDIEKRLMVVSILLPLHLEEDHLEPERHRYSKKNLLKTVSMNQRIRK